MYFLGPEKRCFLEKINTDYLIRIELFIIFSSSVLQIVFGFLRKMPDFNAYALFNFSPFFNFALNTQCNNKVINVFHTWGGWKRMEKTDEGGVWKFYDRTNITKINRTSFCYEYISYKDLLNNGQIITNGTKCPKEYNKNCGRIDSLNQELCIKKNDKCPLYDIGIGLPPDDTNYIYDRDSNIYYNNDNYNITNKTIISKLILNDGQPCYQLTEKLWKQFSSSETDETHLNCTIIQIFGKGSDNKYIKKGEITYKKLYEDNLSERAKNIIINTIPQNEKVYLYKREFNGLDKKCDEKLNLIDNFNSFVNIQGIDGTIQIIEGMFITFGCVVLLVFEFFACCENFRISLTKYLAVFIIYMIIVSGCFCFHVIAYINLIKNDYSYYNCSDSITNEIIRKGNENNRNKIKYNMITTFADGIIIAGNLIALIIGLIWDKIENSKIKNESEYTKDDINTNCGADETPYYDMPK